MTRLPVLLGDVGGTNTRLGLAESPGAAPMRIGRFRNRDHGSFEALLERFLAENGLNACAGVYLAVAGTVEGETVALTNCDWRLDGRGIRQAACAPVLALLNDLEALALALGRLPASALVHVAGPALPRDREGRKLVLGAGTGFNAASIAPGEGAAVLAAECGHMTLPVETAEGLRLRDYLARGRGRASVERAVSGQGLAEVYRWAAEEAGAASEALSARAITDRAARGVDPLCLKAAETVLRIFATIAGDLALAYLPYGGVYLAGSVARALAPMMGAAGFEEIFRTKGRQAGLVGSFPLYLITDDAAALTGCSALAALRGAHEMERTG